jgi:uncharacterized NAD(P)/FAD-binding protein YdhS
MSSHGVTLTPIPRIREHPYGMSESRPVVIAVLGGGPRGIGVVERIAANLPELAAGVTLEIHVVDPHPIGAGRIWRRAQSGLLKLNSMAADVTMFTDEASTIDGPVWRGPSLIEWAEGIRSGEITDVEADPELSRQIATLTGSSFPTRRLQSLYLDWFARRAFAALPPTATVTVHDTRALTVRDSGDHQLVSLEAGETIVADLVLYAIGHTGREPEEAHSALLDFAQRHRLRYFAPDFTADADTGTIPAVEPVIVRGMGLAAVDLVVLLTEGRGGRFIRSADDELEYLPSGEEPTLFLGSRRGVPYRSKISSTLVAPRATPRFFSAEVAARLEHGSEELRFREDVWPFIAKEMLWGYYTELFTGHPDRVRLGWDEFAERFARLDWDSAQLRQLIEDAVPDPLDRLDLRRLDRPLAGQSFETDEQLQERLRSHLREDLRLRSAPEHSATLGLFYSLLFAMFDLGTIADSPKWTARSRISDLGEWWFNQFSYIASGPPAHRLEEWIALSRAGILSFLGPDLRVDTDVRGWFTASSPSVPGTIHARTLVDARLPAVGIGTSDNPLLRDLVQSGVGSEEYLEDASASGTTGKLEVRPSDSRVLDPSGTAHPHRFAVGPYTNASSVGAFSRPRTNAVSFRENDRVARALLESAAQIASAHREILRSTIR